MSFELLNTSAPRGVRPGATGFCTVGVTAGVSPVLEERLTLLSGYRWLIPPGEAGTEKNPVAFSHWRLTIGGKALSVLSRICDAGFDYSRRSNRFAHHVVIEPHEQSEPGPAWVMMQPGVMRTAWRGEPMVFEEGPDIPAGVRVPRVCEAWAGVCGDAGWAGVLAGNFAADPSNVSWIIFPHGLDLLPLIDEAIGLLPEAMRWQVTFSTYFTDLPAGMTCSWRCVAAGTRAAADALRQTGSGVVIDLSEPIPAAPDGAYVDAARNGSAVAVAPNAPWTSTIVAAYEERHPDASAAPAAGNRVALAIGPSEEMTAAPASALPVASDAATVAGVITSLQPPVQRETMVPGPRQQQMGASHRPILWVLAAIWPVIVAGAIIAYFHWCHPTVSTPAPVIVMKTDPRPKQASTKPADTAREPAAVSSPAIVQKVEALTRQLDDRDQTISQLRQVIAEVKDDLAAAKILAESGKSSQAELEKLKAEYAAAQARLAAAIKSVPASADRTVELFRDEVELWSGDGNGPPDQLQLDSYPPPEGLIIDRTATQIVLKAGGEGRALPAEVAIIKIDGGRVVLNWIAVNRAQVSAGIRAWLQLSRLTVQRHQQIVATVRFLPMGSADINLDRETTPSLLPGVHWKEALRHVALALPAAPGPGWTVRQKDAQTITLASDAAADVAFDVQIVVRGNEVVAQTTYAMTQLKLSGKNDEKAGLTQLRTVPPLVISVINHENGLVLSILRLKRGQ